VLFSSKRTKVPWYSPQGVYEYTYRGVDKRKELLFCVSVTGGCSPVQPRSCLLFASSAKLIAAGSGERTGWRACSGARVHGRQRSVCRSPAGACFTHLTSVEHECTWCALQTALDGPAIRCPCRRDCRASA
jgi:hypothetical protein